MTPVNNRTMDPSLYHYCQDFKYGDYVLVLLLIILVLLLTLALYVWFFKWVFKVNILIYSYVKKFTFDASRIKFNEARVRNLSRCR